MSVWGYLLLILLLLLTNVHLMIVTHNQRLITDYLQEMHQRQEYMIKKLKNWS